MSVSLKFHVTYHCFYESILSKVVTHVLHVPQEVKQETPEKRQADALASVSGFCAHIEAAIRHTPPAAISRSRIVDRWLRADWPVGRGCITVAGDALHPMTPSLGQGGCIALEASPSSSL